MAVSANLFTDEQRRLAAIRATKLQTIMFEQGREDARYIDTARQTKLESLSEAGVNILIGFVINFTGNWLILPLFGFTTLTLANNFLIGLAFTVISVARQYVIRRWAQDHLRAFNRAIALRIRKVTNG